MVIKELIFTYDSTRDLYIKQNEKNLNIKSYTVFKDEKISEGFDLKHVNQRLTVLEKLYYKEKIVKYLISI